MTSGPDIPRFGYLNTLPIDSIKVDRTFIAKLSDEPDSQRS
jgi:hypothetical protein